MSIPPQLESLHTNTINALYSRSLVSTQDWSTADLDALTSVAAAFQALDRVGVKTPLCPNELAYAVFFDNSTRTKSAWAGAASRLGMQPVIVDGSSTQVAHGETAAETGAMLGMNAHAMGIRHDLILGEGNAFIRDLKGGIDHYLQATNDSRQVPIVNLQCDVDHPTQTLADLLWLREYFPEGIQGKKIAVSWAYSPSYAKPLSVPQGLIMLLSRYGADLRLAHPPGYQLIDDCMDAAKKNSAESGGSFTVVDSMDAAFEDADIVYPKSWGPYDLMLERVQANRAGDQQAMGEIEGRCLSLNAQFTDWICDEEKMAKTRGGDALYMHCLPADIGDEVSPAIMEKHRVNVAREANWKVYVIMSMLACAKVPNLTQRLRGFCP
ncbi:MAG: knotted carbamoyltransferase YgeW [Myxococcales bacterium]|nr:knotted carbamoyltransferase YgeW [Myxococcales bacterium]